MTNVIDADFSQNDKVIVGELTIENSIMAMSPHTLQLDTMMLRIRHFIMTGVEGYRDAYKVVNILQQVTQSIIPQDDVMATTIALKSNTTDEIVSFVFNLSRGNDLKGAVCIEANIGASISPGDSVVSLDGIELTAVGENCVLSLAQLNSLFLRLKRIKDVNGGEFKIKDDGSTIFCTLGNIELVIDILVDIDIKKNKG